MNDSLPTAKRYAVLIGIDAYPTKPLKSCVRDVQKIKNCLEKHLGSVNVQILTASKRPDSEPRTPAEHPSSWPTSESVELTLESVTSQAVTGDYIYIHFSGHGTRSEPIWDCSNKSTGDLALVLLDDDGKESIFYGPRLAFFLNAMIQKGLVVSLVLDCCFSASVYRDDDTSIRYLPLSSEIVSRHISNPLGNYVDGEMHSTNRDASMRDNWLINPDGYAILAACGPHETAKGGFEEDRDGEWYGALSYYLSEALSIFKVGRKYKDIHRHLCAKFWESSVPQNPVLYGNKEQGFFGPVQSSLSVMVFPVIKQVSSEKYQLMAGRAHGLSASDCFIVQPPDSEEDNSRLLRSSRARIQHIAGLTSELEFLGTTPESVETGWIAEPCPPSYLSKSLIRLAPNLPCRNEWLRELKSRSFTAADIDQNPVAFQVIFQKDDEHYKIQDESGQTIISLPATSWHQTDPGRVCNILKHLAQFKMLRNLVNEEPSDAFRDSFESHLQILGTEKRFAPGHWLNVQDGTKLELFIENKGICTLYIHVYNLGPCWHVKNILRATYEVIPPQKAPRGGYPGLTGTFQKKLKVSVPSMMEGFGSCEDVIKVFITSQQTSFECLELPKLNELAETSATNRVSHSIIKQGSEDWLTLDFPIRVSL